MPNGSNSVLHFAGYLHIPFCNSIGFREIEKCVVEQDWPNHSFAANRSCLKIVLSLSPEGVCDSPDPRYRDRPMNRLCD